MKHSQDRRASQRAVLSAFDELRVQNKAGCPGTREGLGTLGRRNLHVLVSKENSNRATPNMDEENQEGRTQNFKTEKDSKKNQTALGTG